MITIHTIDIKNFRTINDLKLEFPDTGVTVISGPNEVGKSTVMKALSAWKTLGHTSKSQEVTSAAPVGRDVAPEVTVEMTVDGYRFSLRKRWLKTPRAELTVTRPVRRNDTGKDAEKWVEQLFARTDQMLPFEALTVNQDSGTWDFLDVRSSTAVVHAAHADGDNDDDQAAGLRADIKKELGKYFTAGLGHKTGVYRDALKEHDDAKQAKNSAQEYADNVAELRDELRRVNQDITQAQAAANTARSALAAAKTAKEKVTKAKEERDRAQQAKADAENRRERYTTAHRARVECQREYDERSQRVSQIKEEYERIAQDAHTHATRLAEAMVAHTEAEQGKDAASTRLRRLELHQKWAEKKKEADSLRSKLAAGDAAHQRRRAADEKLRDTSTAIDDDALTELTDRHQTWRNQEDSLELSVGTIRIGGPVGDDATGDYPMDRPQRMTLGDYTVEIFPASDIAERRKKADLAQCEYEQLLAHYCVESLSDAKERNDAFRRVCQERDDAQRDQERAWGGSRESLAAEHLAILREIADLEDEVANEWGEETPQTHQTVSLTATPTRQDIDGAKATEQRMKQAYITATQNLHTLRQEDTPAQLASITTKLKMAQDECDKAQKTLTTAQESLPDDALDRELKNAECECEDHRIACEKAENYYHSLKPDQVDHKVEQTQRDVQDLERRLTEYREKKMRIEGEIKGKYSSDTDLSEAEEMLTQKINALTSVELRAHAAQRLHDLVEKHYQDAKEKYFGPYIQALTKKAGRVFGADVSFTTDDTVANGTSSKKTRNQRIVAATQVSQRVLDGRAVNVADLSGGAVEQLQIVQRLAVADVVGDKSVPIFLDDALGYADNERITKMNELLTESGKKHQVIIMTCAPERYRSVDAARSIEMF